MDCVLPVGEVIASRRYSFSLSTQKSKCVGYGFDSHELTVLHRMKRLLQAKTLKQKVNKQLETLGRLQYRDVRILVKNMIYVTGMKMLSGSTEEVSCRFVFHRVYKPYTAAAVSLHSAVE